MSYRYTATKKQQSNRKFAQKQKMKQTTLAAKKTSASIGSKKPAAKKNTQLKKKTEVKAKNLRSASKPITTKALKEQKQAVQRSQRERKLWLDWLLSFLGIMILLYLVLMLIMKSVLPMLFSLDEEKNILLIGANAEQKAERIYILRLAPESEMTKVFVLDANALVPVAGGYGEYPLGSVAPFLSLTGEKDQQNQNALVAVYNFALKQALDEVYFVPDLPDLTNLKAVRESFWSLVKEEFATKSQIQPELAKIFLYLQKENNFSSENLSLTANLALAKEKNVTCPVVIINTTKINGLASQVSAVLEMSGALIVNLESNQENLAETEVFYDEREAECGQLLTNLQNSLPKIGQIIPDQGEKGAQKRAKMVIKLGRSLAE